MHGTCYVIAVCASLTACASYLHPARETCIHTDTYTTWLQDEWGGEENNDRELYLSHGEDPKVGADFLIANYQKYLRRPQGPSCCGCPFWPSCSVYGRQAFQRYGWLVGFSLTMDRLLVRENPGRNDYYGTVCAGGQEKLYDPVP